MDTSLVVPMPFVLTISVDTPVLASMASRQTPEFQKGVFNVSILMNAQMKMPVHETPCVVIVQAVTFVTV